MNDMNAELSAPCRCVYPDKCFCTPAQKRARKRNEKKRTQFISSDEAAQAKCQHTVPCSDCPWTRKSLPGWLGSLTPAQWIVAAHGEGTAECHTLLGAQCAGFAIYRANTGKLPRDPKTLRLPANTKLVFTHPNEFLRHHYRDIVPGVTVEVEIDDMPRKPKAPPRPLTPADELKARLHVTFCETREVAGLSEIEAYEAALELAESWREILHDLKEDAKGKRGEPWEP